MRTSRVGVAGCWVVMLACGGVVQRQGGEDAGGRSSTGGPSSSAGRNGSNSHAGAAGSGMTSVSGSASTVGGSVSAVAGTASATAGTATNNPGPAEEPAPCFNDTDCPGATCGGQVCNWTLAHPKPVGEKVFVCNPAGSQPRGQDGWCTTDANCKCNWAGAKCIAPYCSFTEASDIPGG